MTIEPRRPNQAPQSVYRLLRSGPGSTGPKSDPAAEQTPRPPLVRITVNLTGPADRALAALASGQGLSKTDSVNRALQVAAILHAIAPDGHLTVVLPDGTKREIHIV
ncbi:hypothetical protein O7627_35710 [Solwaraspora sp. WMMD1047]|uniref:hypothetical protein n=1 Tax=Solwaraspora sp. WMMD1047 TaxID=3016102 RepID=UPI00241632F5|nr:hypothetical protein [Solwaraspora sp. WMMD1047]MDG4834619.1 hypothetical protein [Solwaraspora sp. WMMD1047]